MTMNFDLTVIPFSRYGSYMAISQLTGLRQQGYEGLFLRSVHGRMSGMPTAPLLGIELLRDGQPVAWETIASPTVLRLEAAGGYAEFCFPEPDVLRVYATGVTVYLFSAASMFDNMIPRQNGRWQIKRFGVSGMDYMLTTLRGRAEIDAPWHISRCEHLNINLIPGDDGGEWALEEFLTSWQEHDYDTDFAACVQSVEAEFADWVAKMPAVPEKYAEAREIASYIDWSCVVKANGLLPRDGMYMSKNWMTNIWSWDNCFNALALIDANPALAWDQFMLLFDFQHESGVMPDFVNDVFAFWAYCKPPVHGWTLQKLMASDYVDDSRLAEIYGPLSRWTEWWFAYRDDDGDGIPQYNHGNDSGWDNSTVFAIRPPIEAPDLLAFLIIQMDVLADVARKLGKSSEAESWQARAEALLERLLAHFWRGERFVALQSGTHEVIAAESLLLYVPIILGQRLPDNVRQALIADLKDTDKFLTDHGLATEMMSSPLYQSDGYWRGPIWAPSTMILIDGLAAAGEVEFARELSRRFCDMAARHGMAENYDAITGAGLCDLAYTWTSSVFLVLAHEYLMD